MNECIGGWEKGLIAKCFAEKQYEIEIKHF